MFINKNSLQVKISGGNYINLGQYITNAQYGYHKLWGKDSGRSLAGTMTGTLQGIFPKITVNFKRLTQNELETLAPVLDSARQTLKYYDPNKKANIEMTTYTGDWEVTNKSIIGTHKNEPFQISFISVQRRA